MTAPTNLRYLDYTRQLFVPRASTSSDLVHTMYWVALRECREPFDVREMPRRHETAEEAC